MPRAPRAARTGTVISAAGGAGRTACPRRRRSTPARRRYNLDVHRRICATAPGEEREDRALRRDRSGTPPPIAGDRGSNARCNSAFPNPRLGPRPAILFAVDHHAAFAGRGLQLVQDSPIVGARLAVRERAARAWDFLAAFIGHEQAALHNTTPSTKARTPMASQNMYSRRTDRFSDGDA